MQSLQTIQKKVLKLNKTTQPIDTGILELVVGLIAFDIPTRYSCAGHEDRPGTFPYIDIQADDSFLSYDDFSPKMIKIKKAFIKKNVIIQAKLLKLLTEFYKRRKVEYKYQIALHSTIDWAGVRLKSIGADLLKNLPAKTFKKELLIYQSEMKNFGSFLINKYRKI
jgi:hypothetical protein